MKKLLLIGIIGAVALVAVVKKTNVCSYASTLVSQASSEAQNQVPTKFELQRVRHEIAQLDGDISQMIRPIAEYKVVIEKMRKDITKTQTKIEDQKKTMLGVVEDLQANKQFVINGKTYSHERIRLQLQRDTQDLKQLEKYAKAQEQILEAKELSLKATQDQLAKVISKKREYEVRLAQLEAEEETLNVAKIGSTVRIDTGRATQIEDALNSIEHRQNVARQQAQMETGDLVHLPLNERTTGTVDLQTIRNYLEGNATTDKAVSSK